MQEHSALQGLQEKKQLASVGDANGHQSVGEFPSGGRGHSEFGLNDLPRFREADSHLSRAMAVKRDFPPVNRFPPQEEQAEQVEQVEQVENVKICPRQFKQR